MQNSERIWQLVDGHGEDQFIELSDCVWGMPEIAYNEYASVAEHTKMLQAQGFRVAGELSPTSRRR